MTDPYFAFTMALRLIRAVWDPFLRLGGNWAGGLSIFLLRHGVSRSGQTNAKLILHDDPHGMDDARDIA